MGNRWPLVGRSEELRIIRAAVGTSSGARGVVLAGEAGVGKTRLAREVLDDATRSGMVTWWVTGTVSARSLPLGAFAALLPSVGSDPLRALGEAAEALLAGAGGGGTFLVLDDGHLLDEMSALLVHHLVTSGAATVVITVRSGAPAPDAVTAVWKDGHLDRLEVPPLSHTETAGLLEAVLGGPLDGGSVFRMWRLARGNALFLRELVGGERAAGRLGERGGVWRWAGGPVLSPVLMELVETRMSGLTQPIGEVVDLLAFAGSLGVAELRRLGDPAAVEEAETAGLISVELEGRRLQARLAHPLYGEARRARTGVLRARRLRGRIAQALSDTGARRADDELRVAAFTVESDLKPEPELLERAARRSAQLQDLPLAVRLARASVAAGGGFEAQFIVVQAVSMQGLGAEAESERRVLDALARSDTQHARAAIVQAANLFWVLRRPAEAEGVLAAAVGAVSDETARRLLGALSAAFDAFLARPDRAERAADLALGAPDLPPLAVLLAVWGKVLALGVTGRAEVIRPAMVLGYASTQSFDTAIMRFPLAGLETTALVLAGYLHRADEVASRCRQEAGEMSGVPRLIACALSGQTTLARGRLRDAVRWLREALTGFADDPGGWGFLSLLRLAPALAMAGDPAGAQRALDGLAAARHPAFAAWEPEIVLARAWVSAGQGAVSEALSSAHEAARVAAASGLHAYEVLALHTAVRFGDRAAAARLSELARRVDGPRAPAAAVHAKALADDDGEGLRAASAMLEAMGDLPAAADAAAQAAAAHARHGRPTAARVDAGRAHSLAQACQGARSPALLAGARPLPLTPREREIAVLAARGLSNRKIAERLVVSVRTVEGHLYRVGGKLGISRRSELADLFRDDCPGSLPPAARGFE